MTYKFVLDDWSSTAVAYLCLRALQAEACQSRLAEFFKCYVPRIFVTVITNHAFLECDAAFILFTSSSLLSKVELGQRV